MDEVQCHMNITSSVNQLMKYPLNIVTLTERESRIRSDAAEVILFFAVVDKMSTTANVKLQCEKL